MVVHNLPKVVARVRFPYPAQTYKKSFLIERLFVRLELEKGIEPVGARVFKEAFKPTIKTDVSTELRGRGDSRIPLKLLPSLLFTIFILRGIITNTMKPAQNSEKPIYPMRINKYLAHQGFSTRRGADDLITRRKVTINGKIAVLGDKVNQGDIVKMVNAKGAPKRVYYAYHKPLGIIRSKNSEKEPDIILPYELKDTAPVSDLDKNAHGLILVTNDGRITERMRNPQTKPEEEYIVRVKGKLRSSFRAKMAEGVTIEGFKTKPQSITIQSENSFSIALKEEKNNQIRRMCVALFQEVVDLKRVRIGSITLTGLAPEAYRPIEKEELTTLLKALKLQ